MKIILSYLTSCLFLVGIVRAQYVEIGTFNGVLEDLKVYNSELFIGGNFSTLNGNPSYWSAIYNGSSFTNHTNLLGGSGINRFGIYDFDLYATGSVDGEGLAQWDGNTWSAFGGFTDSHTGILGNGQEFFVGSDFGNASLSVSGAAFTSLPPLGQNIYAIDSFNGDIFVAGDFTSSPSGPVNRIARWDGTDWQPLGQGMTGGFGGGSVRSLASYKGELYAGGIFTVAGATPANNIARWDGNAWSDVGGSVSNGNGNGVRDMVVFNDELYVVGDFTEIGGVTTKYVAKWDGTSWSGLSLDASTDFANCVEVYNNHLYVGTFDFTDAKLYEYALSVGLDEVGGGLIPLTVHQDRAEGLVSVSWDRELFAREADVKVLDLHGRILFSGATRNAGIEISAGGWEAGMYIVMVTEGDGKTGMGAVLGRTKFVQY